MLCYVRRLKIRRWRSNQKSFLTDERHLWAERPGPIGEMIPMHRHKLASKKNGGQYPKIGARAPQARGSRGAERSAPAPLGGVVLPPRKIFGMKIVQFLWILEC
jgi:hypothetical protein